MSLTRCVFLGLCFLITLTVAWGQTPVHKVFDHKNGLTSNDVKGVSQDNLGYLWFLNGQGITRYDGIDFKYFPLGTDYYKKVYQDYKGRVWLYGSPILTQFKKLYYCESGKIHEYPYNNVIDSISGVIKTILVDGNDNLWIGFRTEAGDNRPSFMKISPEGLVEEFHFETSVERHVTLLMRVGDAYATATKGSGMQFVDSYRLFMIEGEDTFTCNFRLVREGHFLKHQERKFFITGRDGIFELLGKELHRISSLVNLGSGLSRLDKSGKLFIPSVHYGLYCFDSVSFIREPRVLFPDVHFNSIFQSTDGGYWMGTRDKGLFYVPSLEIQTFDEQMGLPASMVRSLQVLDTNVWITYRQEMSRVAVGKDVLKIDNYHIGGILYHSHLYRDSLMFLGGINDMSVPDNFPYEMLVYPGSRQMRPFAKGTLSYTSGHSLHSWYRKPSGRILNFLVGDFVKSHFQIDYNHFLYSDIGGLKRYLRNTVYPLGFYDTLFTKPIYGIEPINEGWTLLASEAYGVMAMKDTANVFSFGAKQGLSGNICRNLRLDKDSTFWVVTENGLDQVQYSVTRDTMLLKVIWQFGKEYGVPFADVIDLEVNTENVWLAFRNSVLRIPKKLYDEADRPLKPIVQNVYKSGLRIKSIDSLEVPYFFGNLDFEISSPCFTNAGDLRYRFRLKDVDTLWRNSQKRTLSLERVKPGDHVLQIIAENRHGLKSHIVNKAFTITPLIWQTWGFKVILVLLMLVAAGFYWHRLRKQRSNRKRLIQEIKGYQNKSLRLQMNPHFLYNSLGGIQSFVLKKESKVSSKYIAKLSRLMRLIFDHNNCELITLEEELEALQLYVDLEFLRHDQQYKFELQLDPELIAGNVLIPPMLLQPLVENAILHGLVPNEGFGLVSVSIKHKQGGLHISVSDNGKGIRFGQDKEKGKRRVSGGMITSDRIALFNQQHNFKGNFKLDEQSSFGTRISFSLPLLLLK